MFSKYTKKTQVILDIVILVTIVLILGGSYYFVTSSIESGKKNYQSPPKEQTKDSNKGKEQKRSESPSKKEVATSSKDQVTTIKNKQNECEDLSGEGKKKCRAQKKKEEAILKNEHQECLNIELEDIQNECLFKIVENRMGKMEFDQEDFSQTQEICSLITTKEKRMSCLEHINVNTPSDIEKDLCSEIYSQNSTPWELKKCKDRTFAFKVKSRIRKAETQKEKKDILNRCVNKEDPLALEFETVCIEYGLEEIEYNCDILEGEIKDHCITQQIYKENDSMSIQDCQQIPLEKERRVCIKEVEEHTHRNELDSDEDGVSDGKELTYNMDPFDADTDNDGLTDGEEIGGEFYKGEVYSTDPLDGDTDNDNFSDYKEVKEYNTDPLNPQDAPE